MSATVTTPVHPTYELDPAAQVEILALMAWDEEFLKRTDGLIRPEYFDNQVEQILADIAIRHYEKYGETPSAAAWIEHIKEGIKSGRIRSDVAKDVVDRFKHTHTLTVRSRAWIMDKVEEFAQQQAITGALMEAVRAMAKPSDPDRFKKVREKLTAAFEVGLAEQDEDYDYFERIPERTKERRDIASGVVPPRGITTGCDELDACLFHRGWGRQEMSLFMGGAKSTKSFMLSFCAAKAVLAGKKVLFVTLENSIAILSNRIDAQMSSIGMDRQFAEALAMEAEVLRQKSRTGGILKIRWAPTGTLTPAKLQRWIDEYKAKGIKFDLIVIDYMQLMAPNIRTKDPIENSKSIFIDTRAIAQVENAALLSAVQTNREGHKSAVSKAEHVSEDFNIIRLGDVVIAINRTDEERAEGKARLTFAAGRNQADNITLFIKQDLNLGLAIKEVESVE